MTGIAGAGMALRQRLPRIVYVDAPVEQWRLAWAALFAVPAIVFCLGFDVLRPLNELPLAASAACAIISAFLVGRLVVPLGLVLLVIVSSLWLMLSLLRALPSSWTVYYDAVAAVRHWSWIILIPIFMTAYYALFRHCREFVTRHAMVLAIGYYVLGRINLFVSGNSDPERDFFFYGVSNLNMPMLALFYFSLFSRKRPVVVDVLLILAVAVLSTSMTNLIVAMSAMAIRLTPAFRLAPAGVAACLLTMLAVAPSFAPTIYNSDNNAGVRAIMWRDAIIAVSDTNGVGVGFGTEYITNEFGEVAGPDWQLMPERDPTRLFISTHSAFYDVLLRLGVLGAALLFLWLGRYAVLTRKIPDHSARAAASLAVLVYASLAFNPALISVNIFLGVAFVLGLLELLVRGEGLPELPPVDGARAQPPGARRRR